MNKFLLQLCSWRSPELLKSCIESLMLSITHESHIVVTLNEGDDESIKYLTEKKIPYIFLPLNLAVPAVDFTLPFVIAFNCDFVVNLNDDMIFHKGWQDDFLDLYFKHKPCSVSCSLIEPYGTNNPIVYIDNLGEVTDNNTLIKFVNNVQIGKYNRSCPMVSYNHPIMVSKQDYLDVGGYSHWFDFNFFPGYGLDDDFAYRLWKKYEGKFKFVGSNKSFVYHGISQTNKKLSPEIKARSGVEYFSKKNGLTIQDFRYFKINIFNNIDDK